MLNITIEEFKALLARPDWERSQSVEVLEATEPFDYGEEESENYDDQPENRKDVAPSRILGGTEVVSKLDNVTIRYSEGWCVEAHDWDTFSADTEGLSPEQVWVIEGMRIIDNEGHALDALEIGELMPDVFKKVDYSGLEAQLCRLGEKDADSDGSDCKAVTESVNEQEYVLEIDGYPNIRFRGSVIARESSFNPYNDDRWTVMTLYRTRGGKYVCHTEGRTKIAHERNRYSGRVCETINEVKEFFGYKWLAKNLYEAAGIDFSVTVD